MRRSRIPSYRLHRSSGQAVVTINGRDCYLGLYDTADSQRKYDLLIAEWLSKGAKASTPAAMSVVDTQIETIELTVNAVMLRFMEYAATYYSKEGRELDQFKLSLRPLREVCGPMLANAFGPKALKTVQRRMVELGWCRRVVNRRVTRIRTMMKWAESEELLPFGTTHALATVRGLRRGEMGVKESKPIKPAQLVEVQAVVPHCSPTIAAMLLVQFLAGMRSCEVRLMRTTDIDRTNPKCWLYRPSKHKNDWRESGQERVIPLGPECQKHLMPFLSPSQPAAFVFQPNLERRPKHRGRPTIHGKPLCYSANTYAQAVKRACQRAGVMFRPYALRHGRKMMIERLENVEGARTVLGQKSIQTTQHYGRLDLERAIDIMSKHG
jgi:integrase